MTSRERVLRNCTFQSIDRFTIDFCAESAVYAALRAHFGVSDDPSLMEKLHVDFRYPKPEWIGFPLVGGQSRRTDYFGIPRGGAGDFGYALEHPLSGVRTIAELEAHPKWPSPDMWDYEQYREDCARFEEYAVLGGVWGWLFEAACDLVSMEGFFLLMHDCPELTRAILERITRFFELTSEIIFEKFGRFIDICFTGDDYRFQRGPMMSPALFDEFVRPYLQRIYNVGRRHGKLIMHHSCGSVARWIPRLMEMGVNILEPVQVRAAGMDPRALAARPGISALSTCLPGKPPAARIQFLRIPSPLRFVPCTGQRQASGRNKKFVFWFATSGSARRKKPGISATARPLSRCVREPRPTPCSPRASTPKQAILFPGLATTSSALSAAMRAVKPPLRISGCPSGREPGRPHGWLLGAAPFAGLRPFSAAAQKKGNCVPVPFFTGRGRRRSEAPGGFRRRRLRTAGYW